MVRNLKAEFCVVFNFMAEIIRPIYVEKEEGVGSVLSRIGSTSEQKLALVFPPNSALFRNVLEVELLKKEVDRLKKEVRIITSDPAQAELAQGLGFNSSRETEANQETDKFLEDFYGTKEKKTISPLIKPEMSDIVSSKIGRTDKIAVKISAEEKSFSEPDFNEEEKKTKETTQAQTEELRDIPRVEPISLTEEDINQTQEAVKKEEKPKEKTIFKIKKPKIFLNALTISPLKKIFITLLLVAVLVFVLTATFIFPKADIAIKPARERAQLSIDVIFDTGAKAVDFEGNTVPSQIFKMTKAVSQEFTATKEEDISKKATGIITIYNAYSSQSQALVKTTRFEAPDGKIFRLLNTVTVPAAKIEGGSIMASSIDAEVIADVAGESYNITPSDFTIPGFKGTDKYKGFYGKSKLAMKGGLVKKGLVVGQEDVSKAETLLKEKLLTEAKDELKKQMGEEFILINESLTADITENVSQPAVGDPADKFTLTLKALAQGFAYKKKDLGDLVEEKIALKVSDKRLTLPDTRTETFTSNDINFTSGKSNFTLAVEEDISWKIDEVRLKEVLSGKNESEAKQAVALFPEIDSAKFSLWPFWITRIPKDIRKIEIGVDY